ncbi:M24 family metallopeptidase [Clostridium tertium]|jgi:Xaa-Pro aminopeptidase|uniref:M24 family metallopeptidase n=1 Tax=Clostridium TaxID=1485 RepID=UPI001D7EC58E|nr:MULTISPECIES: M24 family metallopeptidase [Clostridium]MBS5306086.1 M24 family metallopeptidase [Clostridium sp.]MDB1939322.1 M24 family metallopeptidase [Clostridium tertium]MDB1944507.1 M24 family metallopeptidase [Clostridium tertium]MDB1951774.1 M24 family metallopeptidase [Clostridium tertium]
MIRLKEIKIPELEQNLKPVVLSDETMNERKEKLLAKMRSNGYEAIVIYADLEHGSNFEYLCGFLPRFEEALLILHSCGKAYMVLGNENLNKASKSRIEVEAVHMPYFSLPNQPMETDKSVVEILSQCELEKLKSIGLVGWKNFTSKFDDNTALYDIPYFVVEAIKNICREAKFSNATKLFIGENGVRTINNANEFAHYEFGAALAGNCILETMQEFDEGKTEMQVAEKLSAFGQQHNVVTIMAAGERFEKANMYPSNKVIKNGDRISITTGFKGGLQSRGGYAVFCEEELPEGEKDYLEKVAIPYFTAVKTWLETIHIGMNGKELYDKIEEVMPKAQYGWSLNPGHLCGDEEWLASPVYPDSVEVLRSGMLFQIDIIPSVSGYGGISCESGVMLADEILREKIKNEYPEIWDRIQKRIAYIKEELGINISEEVIPTSSATAYCRPFLLDKKTALTAK